MVLTTEILVFKTNIQTDDHLTQVRSILSPLPAVRRWNVDTDDRDCVLRVEVIELSCAQIINLLTNAGFHCQELD